MVTGGQAEKDATDAVCGIGHLSVSSPLWRRTGLGRFLSGRRPARDHLPPEHPDEKQDKDQQQNSHIAPAHC